MAKVIVHTNNSLTETAVQLDEDKARGIAGYVHTTARMPNNPTDLTKLENQLKPWVDLLHSKGQEAGVRVFASENGNASTPWAPWFDGGDVKGGGPKWKFDYDDNTNPANIEHRLSVLTRTKMFFEMAKRLGLDQVIWDQENYVTQNHTPWCDADRAGGDKFLGQNGTMSWKHNYDRDLAESAANPAYAHLDIPANTHTEAETRAQVRMWGAEKMKVIVAAYPGVNLGVYFNRGIPGNRWAMGEVGYPNDAANPYYSQGVMNDFWDGLLSVPGYGRVDNLDAGWFKYGGTDVPGSWDIMEPSFAAVRAGYGSFPNGGARALNGHLAALAYVWVDQSSNAGELPWANYQGDGKVLEQMKAAAKFGHGNRVHVYTHFFRNATQHWPADGTTGIWAATRAAAAITGPAVLTGPPPTARNYSLTLAASDGSQVTVPVSTP